MQAEVESTSLLVSRPHLSVVAPVYNEAETLVEFHRRIRDSLENLDSNWELVFVDDGSQDESFQVMCKLHQVDSRVRVVRFSRNFGHHIAMTAGLDHAEGDYVVIMDSDLQDRPEEIPRLYEKLSDSDVDVVVAIRKNKKFSWVKRFLSWIFVQVMQRVFSRNFKGGVFRIMKRKVVLAVRRCREQDRLLVGLIDWTGFSHASLEVEHAERHAGESSYPLSKQIQLALNSLTAFSILPLRMVTWLGFLVSILSFLLTSYLTFRRFYWGFGVEGWTSLMVVVMFLSGIQMLALGVIGEYLGRVFTATRERPLYVVDEWITNQDDPK